jgi:hypothetical protein
MAQSGFPADHSEEALALPVVVVSTSPVLHSNNTILKR